jgi:hypothetical protein
VRTLTLARAVVRCCIADKLRELVLTAQDNIFEIEKLEALEAKLELYDKTFIIYNDALNIIRDELRQFQGSKKNIKTESQESDLRFLFEFLSYTKLSRTVDRNLLLVNSLTGKLLESKGSGVALSSALPTGQLISHLLTRHARLSPVITTHTHRHQAERSRP